MTENILHHIWQFQLFNFSKANYNGEKIVIKKPGLKNINSGPDFLNASIQIGNTQWNGSIEIHKKSSDWYAHKHQKDKAYNNVILHVVYENDKKVNNSSNTEIPFLELKNLISLELLQKINVHFSESNPILCHSSISEIPTLNVDNWLDRLLIKRLERKTKSIETSLELTNNDWGEVFYRLLLKYLIGNINQETAVRLTEKLSFKTLGKHSNNLKQLEALLYGVAGFLEEENDDYQKELKKEFIFLRIKYKLQNIHSHEWKFFRLRPFSFPTVRLSQFANLLYNNQNLFEFITSPLNLKEFEKKIRVLPSDYWESHFRFNKVGEKQQKRIGKTLIVNILINVVIPIKFAFGRYNMLPNLEDEALDLLHKLPAESNQITKRWKKVGVSFETSFQSQALIELFNEFCLAKNCLHCTIGRKVLR